MGSTFLTLATVRCQFLFNSSVAMCNMNIIATVMKSFIAILVGNAQDGSKMINISVHLTVQLLIITVFVLGVTQYKLADRLTIYYRNGILKESTSVLINVTNFYYNSTYKSCANHLHCVKKILHFLTTLDILN